MQSLFGYQHPSSCRRLCECLCLYFVSSIIAACLFWYFSSVRSFLCLTTPASVCRDELSSSISSSESSKLESTQSATYQRYVTANASIIFIESTLFVVFAFKMAEISLHKLLMLTWQHFSCTIQTSYTHREISYCRNSTNLCCCGCAYSPWALAVSWVYLQARVDRL